MAEAKTMLPVIETFMTDRRLPDVTVVADAGMISAANQKAIEAAGLSFIPRMNIPDVPTWSRQWRREHRELETKARDLAVSVPIYSSVLVKAMDEILGHRQGQA